MSYTFPISKEMACAKSLLPVSEKHAQFICKNINRMPYFEAKEVVVNMAEEIKPLHRKFCTKTAKEILTVLNTLEANAKARNLETEKMDLYISAHRGPALYRLRRSWKHGKQLKVCNVQAILKSQVKK